MPPSLRQETLHYALWWAPVFNGELFSWWDYDIKITQRQVVAHICNHHIWETGAEGSQVHGQSQNKDVESDFCNLVKMYRSYHTRTETKVLNEHLLSPWLLGKAMLSALHASFRFGLVMILGSSFSNFTEEQTETQRQSHSQALPVRRELLPPFLHPLRKLPFNGAKLFWGEEIVFTVLLYL